MIIFLKAWIDKLVMDSTATVLCVNHLYWMGLTMDHFFKYSHLNPREDMWSKVSMGASLAVQWLRLWGGHGVRSLVGELRFCILCGVAKKKSIYGYSFILLRGTWEETFTWISRSWLESVMDCLEFSFCFLVTACDSWFKLCWKGSFPLYVFCLFLSLFEI